MSEYEIVIIGGGQAGLALSYYLKQQGRDFIILNALSETGESWRNRWDSLVLFTPADYSTLPGLPFPKDKRLKPTKDEVADYLALYAKTFDLPIHHNCRAKRLYREYGKYHIEVATTTITADQVVIATGPYHIPYIPAVCKKLNADVFQIHSAEYRNPAQIPPGDVLVVGGANSGAQIAEELSQTRQVYLSRGRKLPFIPRFMTSHLAYRLIELSGIMRVNIESPLGKFLSKHDAVYGVNLRKLARVEMKDRLIDASDKTVTFTGGETLEVQNIVWATGYKQNFSWIDLPIFDEKGGPCHRRGMTELPGLYFLGLEWLWTRGSALIGWVGRDAEYLASILSQKSR
jgi:putative flavoprotein involved in K+ transport